MSSRGLTDDQIRLLVNKIEDDDIDDDMITAIAVDESDCEYEIINVEEVEHSEQVNDIIVTEEIVYDANVNVELVIDGDSVENVVRPKLRKILTPNILVNCIDAALDAAKYDPVIVPENEVIYEAVIILKTNKKYWYI
jgi:hypothetical protein